MWRPISTLPKSGQALVTSDDPSDDDVSGNGGYGDIELVICPMLADGRILNQNTGNYSRAGSWKWWTPAPERKFATEA